MKKLILQITITLALIATSLQSLYAKGVATPYEHIPVDTFIGAFPLEIFVILGVTSYLLGVVYIFISVFLKNSFAN